MNSVAGAVIMLSAAALPALQKKERQKGKATGYLLGVLWAVVTGLANIINKLYATSTFCNGSDAAYCFYVNVFIILGWSIYLGYVSFFPEKRHIAREALKEFKPEILRLILVIAAVSAVYTLFNLYALSFIELSFYTIITNSAGLVAGACLSRFVYRERLNRYNYASILLALAAIALTAL